jgi:hypothetical protein
VPGPTIDPMRKQLALDLSKTYKENRETVNKMYTLFRWGVDRPGGRVDGGGGRIRGQGL